MNFSTDQKGKVFIVQSNVEKLDASNATELKAQFLHFNKNGNNEIILDLNRTKYCDSSGLSAILVANRLCKDTNGFFSICGLQPSVRKMIEIAQLDKVLSIGENVESILAGKNA
jgi:anti-sigma B factor antagonist